MASSGCKVMRAVVVLSSLCAVFLMADAQTCSLNDLGACLGAVTNKATVPSPACCNEVALVNIACFCDIVKKGNYPADYISNAMAIPGKCQGAAYAHFKGQECAGYRIG